MKSHSILCSVGPRCRVSLPNYFGFNWRTLILVFLAMGWTGNRLSLGRAATPALAASPTVATTYLLKDASIVADFDNDNQPDLAIIRSEGSRYKIEIRLSRHQKSVFYTVPSSARSITLMVCDVDDDEDKDDDLLILDGTSLRPLGVWINNNGDGRFEGGNDPSNSNFIWSDDRSGYMHNRDRRNQAFISQNNRLPFGLFTLGFSLTKLAPEGPISGESHKGSSQILPYALHGRSPPLYSLVRT